MFAGTMARPKIETISDPVNAPVDEPPAGCHPKVLRLFRYWQQMRGIREMPARADFDPLGIPDLLPYIFLIDVPADGGPLVYRLVGTAIVSLFGQEMTGQPVGAGTLPRYRADVLQRYRRIIAARRPFFQYAQLREQTNDFTHVERLILPLCNGRRVDMLLGMTVERVDRR
jgi:hypothetical protein